MIISLFMPVLSTQAIMTGPTNGYNETNEIVPEPEASGDAIKFISRWDTRNVKLGSSDSKTITLPLVGLYPNTYNFTVEWGDGQSDIVTKDYEGRHTYTTEGIYTISITGTLVGWSFYYTDYDDSLKLLEISQWGNVSLGREIRHFWGAENMVITATDAPDLSQTIYLSGTFYNCKSLGTTGSLNSWNVTSITSMGQTFYGATSFNQPLDSWNTSNVAYTNRMFRYASSFNQDISSWDTSKVVNMRQMFQGASTFNHQIGNWDVSKVTDLEQTFANATLFNQPLNTWNTSSVTNMRNIFEGASSFNQDISSWDISSITYLGSAFKNATSFNQPLNTWNTTGVTNMNNMFEGASSFDQPIENWDVSKVTTMSGMFMGATSFNQDISTWYVSSVTDMSNMFNEASSFNQPLDAWNVSSVTSMNSMFKKAMLFNQPLDDWDISSVSSMSSMFEQATSFDQQVGLWDVSSVTSMVAMFVGSSISTINYDDLLQGWSQLTLQLGVTLDVGNTRYSYDATEARQRMIDIFDWTITDGGVKNLSPSQPLNFDDRINATHVVLTWEEPLSNGGVSITEYRIYRSITSGSDFSIIGTSQTTSYSDDIGLPGATYFYVVTAVNSIGESDYSSEIFVSIPPIEPSKPLNLDTTYSDGSVTITWTIPSSDGGATIDEYRIYRSTSSGSGYSFLGFTTILLFQDSNVETGKTYYYVIRAVNSVGEGELSDEAMVEVSETESEPIAQTPNGSSDGSFLNYSLILILPALFTVAMTYKRKISS